MMPFTTGSHTGKRGHASRLRLTDHTFDAAPVARGLAADARFRSTWVSAVVTGLTLKLQCELPLETQLIGS